MVSDLAAGLFLLVVVDPIPAQVHVLAEKSYVSVEAVQQPQECLGLQGPWLLQRVAEEPIHTFGTAAGIATGWTCPIQLWDINDPACSTLARLLLNARINMRKFDQ